MSIAQSAMEAGEERFAVTNDQQADWCLRKIAEADRELERMREWYQLQTEAAQKEHDSRVGYFTCLLQDYFSTVPAKETKTMLKYALPSGELVWNKAKQDFVKEDEEKLLSWCVTNDPELVKAVYSPKWGDLKKRLTVVDGQIVDKETGLFVDGVKTEEKPSEFKVKGKGADDV